MIHFASNPDALKNVAACNTRIRAGMTTSTEWAKVTCVDCLKARPVPRTETVPLSLRDFASIARSEQRRLGDDRARLIDNLDWLIRDLTNESELLKANPTRMPSTSLLTGSLVHDIEGAAHRLRARQDVLMEFVNEFRRQGMTVLGDATR